jgi:hypothetical protein
VQEGLSMSGLCRRIVGQYREQDEGKEGKNGNGVQERSNRTCVWKVDLT